MHSLVAVSHTVCTYMYVGGSKNWGRWVPAPWDGDVADTLETLLPHVIIPKFRRSRSNRLGVVTVGSQNFAGRWGPPF